MLTHHSSFFSCQLCHRDKRLSKKPGRSKQMSFSRLHLVLDIMEKLFTILKSVFTSTLFPSYDAQGARQDFIKLTDTKWKLKWLKYISNFRCYQYISVNALQRIV